MKRSDVKRIAVMGLGKMGVDWVANLLEGGYEVVGFDAVAGARERAPGALAKGLAWIAKKRRPEEADFVDQATARFRIVDSEDAFSAELESCQVLLRSSSRISTSSAGSWRGSRRGWRSSPTTSCRPT